MNYADAHVVHHDLDPTVAPCWATVDLGDCGQPATSDVGLCRRHLEELTAGNSPAAEAWTDDGDIHIAGFIGPLPVILDDTMREDQVAIRTAWRYQQAVLHVGDQSFRITDMSIS